MAARLTNKTVAPPVPLPPEGGGGTQSAPPVLPLLPLGEERVGVRRGNPGRTA